MDSRNLGETVVTQWLEPSVRLLKNPWEGSLTTGFVLSRLNTAAMKAGEWARARVKTNQIKPDAQFAYVLLDPTRPRSQVTIQDRVMVIVLYGDDASDLIANAAAKADAHDRHGRNIGELVRVANFCLGSGDFAYGDSDKYNDAISAGSGFSQQLDAVMARQITQGAMDPIHAERERWVTAARDFGDGKAWFNENNEPGGEYAEIRSLDYTRPADF